MQYGCQEDTYDSLEIHGLRREETIVQAQDLIQRVEAYDRNLAHDLSKFIGTRRLGLVFEESKPEYVRLINKPVVPGDLVNILPPRGELEDTTRDDDIHDVIWRVVSITDGSAHLMLPGSNEYTDAPIEDLIAISRFDQSIYCGLNETGRIERGGDRPYQVVINGENYHALEALLYSYRRSVDCIYIDPPYNSGAKDWKYNNNYVSGEDSYRHSKWLTFMEDRLRIARMLLNPDNSVLICTIDEKEYLRLGLLLEQMFPAAVIQMVSVVTNRAGTNRVNEFSRINEYIYFVMIGDVSIVPATVNESNSENVRWDGLRRHNPTNLRRTRPRQFYPVYINRESGVIEHIGDPIAHDVDRQSVPAVDGCETVFPIRDNGVEMLWGVTAPELKRRLESGYVKVGPYRPGKPQQYSIQILSSGAIRDIESGIATVVGRAEDGSVIAKYPGGKKLMPTTQWDFLSHDANQYGTKMLLALIGRSKFPFPKSLYSVEDAIRLFMASKPNGLVLDFFGGSGTTTHAVMRLNHQDGGHRRSICITNNEVSDSESKSLSLSGHRPGDQEWEKLGICEHVTKPRITAAITGLTSEGSPIKGDYKFTDEFPMADGLEENAVFYDLSYLEPSVISADLAFNEIAPLLWMRAGSYGPIIHHGETYAVTDSYGVLFDYSYAASFIRECHLKNVDHIFVVTDIDANYRHMCSEFRGKDVAQLYKSYLRSFEIGVDR